MHSKLKIFEYLLNLSRKNHFEIYKNNSSLNLNPSKVKEPEIEFNKKLCKYFLEKGAIIDQVKVSYGTSNNWPMVDKLFINPQLIARTLNLDNVLVNYLKQISELLNSKQKKSINLYLNLATKSHKILRYKI